MSEQHSIVKKKKQGGGNSCQMWWLKKPDLLTFLCLLSNVIEN